MNSLRELAGVSFMVQIGLAAAYGYVHLLYRRPAFLWYAIGWASAAGFAMFQSVYAPNPQASLFLNLIQGCVLGACLLMGVMHLGSRSRGIAALGSAALVIGVVSLAVVAVRFEPSVMTHIGNVFVVGVAAIMWINAMRFLGLRYTGLLDILRPEPAPLSAPVLSAKDDGAMENGVVPAWRELRLTRRLMVSTFGILALLELAWLGVRSLPASYLPALFLAAMAAKMAQAVAVGLWVLADMRTTNDRLVVRSIAEELGVLTASIEHDVRNPLGILRRDVDTARLRHRDNRDMSELLDRMMRSIERIAAAVSVVPMIRQAADDFTQHAEALNAVAVVREAMQSVKRASPTDDLHVLMHTAQSDFRIRGERQRLQQAFVNLLNNGVEAARLADRRPHIEVDLARTEDRKSVRISIRDNGCGMTPEQMRQLGQPFYSSKQVGSPNRGIGVFMTKRIVTLHRGAIRFRSDGEAFTLVEVTLPLLATRSRAERDAS